MCEAVALLIVQCPTDTFFLNVILHLCGQLEILRQKLIAFGEGKRDDTDRECILKSLIRRHSKLIQLAENLEKTYCISVLVQLSLIACLMAATGIRLIFSMRHNDQIEIIRISFNWLADDMSDMVYLAVALLQISQTLIMGMRQTVVDSFFFSMMMHLCGQLEVLSIKLKNLGRYHKTDREHKKELVSLVSRHRQLTEHVKNVEDTFNIIILLQILMSVILIALTSIRLIVFLAARNKIQVVLSILAILFFLLQCSLYTQAGDLLQTCSEKLFFNVYVTP
ncbi:hypothetical protein KM043_007141, partial [Ampulex compressa]